MKTTPLLPAALAFVFASVGFAADTAGNAIFVPVVARTPGAFGSQWRTDLVVSNISPSQTPVPFTVTFVPNDGSPPASMRGELKGTTSHIFTDVVNSEFGRTTGVGVVLVTSPDPWAQLTARARVHNTASPVGEFGQHVPGSRVEDLRREHHLTGLTGLAGDRANVGIANPFPQEMDYRLVFFGSGRYGLRRGTLSPHQVIQINDLFGHLGIEPEANVSMNITTSRPAFVYASLVRSDSGGAIFMPAVAPPPVAGEGVVAPPCSAPAPLYLRPDNAAEGWIVMLQRGIDVESVARELAVKHGFTISTLWDLIPAFFSKDVTPAGIAALRCETAVLFIEQNAYGSIGGNR